MSAIPTALLDGACLPYRAAGRFAYHFARKKLAADPAFRAILERGLLRSRQRVLDLGCGQGLLNAWLRAAECYSRDGLWPADWAAAPIGVDVHGIELAKRDVQRARSALGAEAKVSHADIRDAAFGCADVIVILDVLHYLPLQSHVGVLRRARQALPLGGRLLLRVADNQGGWRFGLGRGVDQCVLLLRSGRWRSLHYRSIAHWQSLLDQCGFDSSAIPMSQGTLFANVLLSAQAR